MISIGERVVVVVAVSVSVSVIVGAQVAAIFSPSFFSRSSGSFGFELLASDRAQTFET